MEPDALAWVLRSVVGHSGFASSQADHLAGVGDVGDGGDEGAEGAGRLERRVLAGAAGQAADSRVADLCAATDNTPRRHSHKAQNLDLPKLRLRAGVRETAAQEPGN